MKSTPHPQKKAEKKIQSANPGSEELQNSMNEALVAEARDYAEAIVENIREPLLVLNKNLQVKTANSAFYKTFRVNELETEGVLIYDLGNKQWNIPALRTLLEKILPEKSKFNDFEVIHTFSNIGERIMLLNAREVINKNNSEKLILLSIEDITERATALRKIEESEMLFRNLADAMPQKVWTADAAGNLNYFNSCWFEYTGLTFDELKDWGWERAVHPDDWAATKKGWLRSVATGENFEIEHRFLNTAGIYKWHLTRGLAQKDWTGKIKMWIGTDTEIQEQQEQKEQLEQQVIDRTREVLEANETLEQKIRELKVMNTELESFAYVSSHDLQEPLRKIQTFADRILDKENKNLSERGKDYFQRMQTAANRMQVLIEDILAFARVNA